MAENHIRILCSVIKVDLVYESPEGDLVPFFDSVQDSPLMQSEDLRKILREGSMGQKAPFMYQIKNNVWFSALHAGEGFLFMGPMCGEKLSPARQRALFSGYGIDADNARIFSHFSLADIRNMVLLTNSALKNGNLENEELVHLNQIIRKSEESLQPEKTDFILKEEAQDEEQVYRHSYYEEQLLMQAVKEGRPEDAVRLAEDMDRDAGRLSGQEIGHRRNLSIIGITLCSRAAIEGGLTPEEAYRLSGYYIQKCDVCQDHAHMLHYRNRAIEEMAGRIRERLEKTRSSSYVERCRTYIRKHYREKIYLGDIADALEISPSYLSRVFKKETGQNIQDYVNSLRVERAVNLLVYTDKSLSEIAEYVNFPNQSYFGKIFRHYKQMTPKEYRNRFTPSDKL